MTEVYLSSFVTFTRNEVRTTHLVFFQKTRFQDFLSENLRVVSLLGEKFIFYQLLWDNQNLQEFQTFCVYQCCPSDKLSRTISIMLLLHIFGKL